MHLDNKECIVCIRVIQDAILCHCERGLQHLERLQCHHLQGQTAWP
jgi:hypothetical protein